MYLLPARPETAGHRRCRSYPLFPRADETPRLGINVPEAGSILVGSAEETLLDCKVRANDLHCPICLETFASPIVLRCGHAFDRECLVSMYKGRSLPCPMCRHHRAVNREVMYQQNCQLLDGILQTMSSCRRRILKAEQHQRLLNSRLRYMALQRSKASPSVPWNAVYGPVGVESDDDVPRSARFGLFVAAIIVTFLLFSFILDQVIEFASQRAGFNLALAEDHWQHQYIWRRIPLAHLLKVPRL